MAVPGGVVGSAWVTAGGDAERGRWAESGVGRLGRRVVPLPLAGCMPPVWSGFSGVGAGRGGSQCHVASGAERFAAWDQGCWVLRPVVAGTVIGVWPGRGPRSFSPWG